MIREICRRIGYQGRFVWLVPVSEVHLLASKYTGNSRIRFKVLDITDPPPYAFKRVILRETKPIKLDADTVITALPTLRGRRRDLLCFMNLHRFKSRSWSVANSSKLAPEEIAVCLGQERFDASTTAVAQAICIYRGLVDPRGRITRLGSELLDGKK